jgi:hypothetical protein
MRQLHGKDFLSIFAYDQHQEQDSKLLSTYLQRIRSPGIKLDKLSDPGGD